MDTGGHHWHLSTVTSTYELIIERLHASSVDNILLSRQEIIAGMEFTHATDKWIMYPIAARLFLWYDKQGNAVEAPVTTKVKKSE